MDQGNDEKMLPLSVVRNGGLPDVIFEKLATIRVDKPWGVAQLPRPFETDSDRRIGEIWFDPPVGCPLLAKYLFTSERLSVQVHPDDDEARRRGEAAGKEECWYILHAEPDAKLGIGTVRPLDAEELRIAALSGTIEDLIEWHQAEPGLFFHIPPGTIHAIGGGIALVEIQQNSDVTYRLYDYGRPRALHLDEGLAVARATPMPPQLRMKTSPDESAMLLSGTHFSVAHVSANNLSVISERQGPLLIVPLVGALRADGVFLAEGECGWGYPASALAPEAGARFLAAWPRRD